MDRPKSILIVDDDQDLLDMYEEMFHIDGYELITAKSGQHALELCKSQNIKVIISDSQMPEMSGLELLNQLRREYEHVPVFYLLTGAMEMEEKLLKDQGGHALILKPFDLDEIMRRISNDLK